MVPKTMTMLSTRLAPSSKQDQSRTKVGHVLPQVRIGEKTEKTLRVSKSMKKSLPANLDILTNSHYSREAPIRAEASYFVLLVLLSAARSKQLCVTCTCCGS